MDDSAEISQGEYLVEMACAVVHVKYFYTNRKFISDLMNHCFDILEESVREQKGTSTDLKILTMQMFESGIR